MSSREFENVTRIHRIIPTREVGRGWQASDLASHPYSAGSGCKSDNMTEPFCLPFYRNGVNASTPSIFYTVSGFTIKHSKQGQN